MTADAHRHAAAKLQPASKVGLSGTGGFVWLTDDTNDCALVRITAAAAQPGQPETRDPLARPGHGHCGAAQLQPPGMPP